MGSAIANAGGAMAITGAQFAAASQTAAIVGGAAGGFAGGLVGSGGNLKAGLIGGVSGGMFGWAGGIGGDHSLSRYGAHALAGCASGELGGGGCGRGAASAVAGKWATNHTDGNFIATVVAGGTVSAIGGGKFANGALTSTYGYLFNYCAHDDCTGSFTSWVQEKWDGYLAYRQQLADMRLAAYYGDAAASQELAYDMAMGFAGGAGTVSGKIAGGHAFGKHVLGVGARADDPLFRGLAIRTVAQLETHVASVMANPTAQRTLSGGRTAYWHQPTGTVVIHNSRASDMGSVFQPTRGRAYFDALK